MASAATADLSVPGKRSSMGPLISRFCLIKAIQNSTLISVFCTSFFQVILVSLAFRKFKSSFTNLFSVSKSFSCNSRRQKFAINLFKCLPWRCATDPYKVTFLESSLCTRLGLVVSAYGTAYRYCIMRKATISRMLSTTRKSCIISPEQTSLPHLLSADDKTVQPPWSYWHQFLFQLYVNSK